MVGLCGQFFHPVGDILGYIGGADFHGRAVLIFISVIEESGLRDDLDGRQRLAVDDTAGKFPSLDICFDDKFIFVEEGFLQCFLVLFLGADDIDADAGASGAGLDDDRKGQAHGCKASVLLRFVQAYTHRSVDAGLEKDLFSQTFVHGYCAAQ